MIEYIFLLVGGGIMYILSWANFKYKKRSLYNFVQAIKKKKPIAFLETDKAIHYRIIEKGYQNLVITPEKEIIIGTKSSPKPCINLGGVEILHGDLYKSITTPQELRVFVDKLKDEGWTNEDIADFLAKIEILPSSGMEDSLRAEASEKKCSILQRFGVRKAVKEGRGEKEIFSENQPKDVLEKLQNEDMKVERQISVYKNIPSIVKDFVYTGINRTSLHAMLRELVYQRELERMGKRNWIAIGVMVLLILIGIWFVVGAVARPGGLVEMFMPAAAQPPAPPSQINLGG